MHVGQAKNQPREIMQALDLAVSNFYEILTIDVFEILSNCELIDGQVIVKLSLMPIHEMKRV